MHPRGLLLELQCQRLSIQNNTLRGLIHQYQQFQQSVLYRPQETLPPLIMATFHRSRPEPQVQTRDIDLTADIEDKDRQIEVLESLLSCYENNPLIINKFVVCQYETLMNIIKVLTNGEKVEFSLDEDKSCTCCNSKYIYISKIFVTKDGKTQEFKHAFNEKYSLLQRHGISLKICTR